MVRSLIVALLLGGSLAFAAPGQTVKVEPAVNVDPQKAADIRTLMKLTVSGDVGKQVLSQIITGMSQQVPNVPPAFWTEFGKQVNTDELVELLIPIYDKHFTREDLKALIAFYETPVGKKFTRELPGITQDSITVGSAWGRKLGERAMQELQKQQKSSSPPPATKK